MRTLREEIVNAICEGFVDNECLVDVHDDYTDIYVGDTSEPIKVLSGLREPPDVLVPEVFGRGVASGIYLDVRTILVEDSLEAENRKEQNES